MEENLIIKRRIAKQGNMEEFYEKESHRSSVSVLMNHHQDLERC